MCRVDGWFYWIGENRTGRVRVSCYRSRDLENWEFRRHILTLDSPKKEYYVRTDTCMERDVETGTGEICFKGCNIERPKVIYNAKTGNMSCGCIMRTEDPTGRQDVRWRFAIPLTVTTPILEAFVRWGICRGIVRFCR